MEVFLERLLLELVFIAAEVAIMRLLAWLGTRGTTNAGEGVIAAA
jgi:hypothetical protein